MNSKWFKGVVFFQTLMGVFAILVLVFGISVVLTAIGDLPLVVGIVLCVSAPLGALAVMYLAEHAYEEEMSLAYEQGWQDGVGDAIDESPEHDY